MQIDTQATNSAKTPAAEPATFQKRIGSTNFTVAVHFSKTSKETMGDKIIRMIKNDVVSK